MTQEEKPKRQPDPRRNFKYIPRDANFAQTIDRLEEQFGVVPESQLYNDAAKRINGRPLLPQDKDFLKRWHSLTSSQRHWIIERQASKTDAEAARAAGLSLHTVRGWPSDVRAMATEVSTYLGEQALELMRAAMMKASYTLIQQMDHHDPRVAQKAAQLILDYTMKQMASDQERQNAYNDNRQVNIYLPDNQREPGITVIPHEAAAPYLPKPEDMPPGYDEEE